MKFNCNQQVLSKTLAMVSRAVTVRTTMPILKGILIQAQDDKLTFSASDLDISIEKTIDAVVDEPGSIVVSSKLFNDIIRRLPNETIFMELKDETTLNIKTATSEFTIVGQPADEFPNIATIEDVQSRLSFNKEIFTSMIKKTAFSAATDENKGVIVGVLLELEENNFNMVALDGFRMAICREQMKNEKSGNIIIPGKILSDIRNILLETSSDEDVEIILGNKKAIVLIENTKIVVRLIDGAFIKYKEILASDNTTRVIIDRSDLLTGIERASLLAKEGKNNLIKCVIKENLLTITSRSEEGTVKEEIIMEKVGEDLEIGFNSKYLLEALKVIEDDEIVLEFKTAVTPCLIKPIEGNNYEYLVLPVRITSN